MPSFQTLRTARGGNSAAEATMVKARTSIAMGRSRRAPGVEGGKADGPGTHQLAPEQVRNEVARDHEEHVDADVAPAERRGTCVVGDDQGHSQGPEALDVSPIAPLVAVTAGPHCLRVLLQTGGARAGLGRVALTRAWEPPGSAKG